MTFKKIAGFIGSGILAVVLLSAAIVIIGALAKGICNLLAYGWNIL